MTRSTQLLVRMSAQSEMRSVRIGKSGIKVDLLYFRVRGVKDLKR